METGNMDTGNMDTGIMETGNMETGTGDQTLETWDYVVIVVYFAFVLFIGLWVRKKLTLI